MSEHSCKILHIISIGFTLTIKASDIASVSFLLIGWCLQIICFFSSPSLTPFIGKIWDFLQQLRYRTNGDWCANKDSLVRSLFSVMKIKGENQLRHFLFRLFELKRP